MSVAPETVRIIRVFVSSPGDVQEERDVLEEVVESINRTDGRSGGFRLELFRWEDDVTPQIGPGPQVVVDRQTPVYQIYVGILKHRFGTPTGRHGSGTEKEFRDALQRWGETGSPWILFYFCDDPVNPRQLDLKQYGRVNDFRNELESTQRGIYATYVGTRGSGDSFYQKVQQHLRQVAQRLRTEGVPTAVVKNDTSRPTEPTVPGEYTDWLLGRCGDVELMGLEIKHGSGVRLNHVYTPLATSSRPLEAKRGRRRGEEEAMPEEQESVQLLLPLLERHSLYVSGDPGSGKSTFCRWVTWLTCNGEMPVVDVAAPDTYQEAFPDQLQGRLPVLVRLRDFWQFLPPAGIDSIAVGSLEHSLELWLADQNYPGMNWQCLKGHLEHGSALLMLDGVDEVPPTRTTDGNEWYPRQMLLAGLAQAVAQWSKAGNRVLVTSRPYGLSGEQQRQLALLHAPILGLDQQLQALLVRRWFLRLKEDQKLGLETADAMIDHIHVERGLDDLAVNPLLLTAMCIIYDEGKRLPHDKYTLYDRIVDTVLHKRYAGRESIDVIRGRLAAVALGMHTGEAVGQNREAPEAFASAKEIGRVLESYHKLDGSTDAGLRDIASVREDLLSRSGLLVDRGDEGASFYHLSIQEFLAAERLFLLHGRDQEQLADLLVTRGHTAGWRNTASFVFGCLVATFKSHAGVECLQQLVKRLVPFPVKKFRAVRPLSPGGGEGEHARDLAAERETRSLETALGLPTPDPSGWGQADDVWNSAIVLGDCLQILAGRKAAIPEDLIGFFQHCVYQAIEQQIAVKDRQTLAVALGRLGDPRVAVDLRVESHPHDHPGYVRIPEGKYYVGDEKKPITIDQPYWLSKYPVTNLQYALFVDAGGYVRRDFWSDEGWQWIEREGINAPDFWRDPGFNAPNQPVVGVSWWEAEAFCKWAGVRLCRADEAEAAARGPKGLKYPWGNDWEDGTCNSRDGGLRSTSAVGIFPQDCSPFGLMDTAGNVWEWCADHGKTDWDTDDRVIRGGGWEGDAGYCRGAFRYGSGPEDRYDDLGFRVAAVPPGGQGQEPGNKQAEPGAEVETA